MASIRILGCTAGAIRGLRSTALLVNRDTLIDCGSGVGDLTLEEMTSVQQVLLTHAHLDHTMFLPLLADATLLSRSKPLDVYALPETLQALRQHLFNGVLWPDYITQPDPATPYVRIIPIRVGETVTLSSCRYTALPARHSIPTVGYWLDAGSGSLAFSGDSGDCPGFWEAVNAIGNLRYVMMETTSARRGCRSGGARRAHHAETAGAQRGAAATCSRAAGDAYRSGQAGDGARAGARRVGRARSALRGTGRGVQPVKRISCGSWR